MRLSRTVGIGAALAFGLLILAGDAAAQSSSQQIIYLRDGSVLHGRITETANGMVTIETDGGVLHVRQDSIDHVDYNALSPAAPATPPPPQGDANGDIWNSGGSYATPAPTPAGSWQPISSPPPATRPANPLLDPWSIYSQTVSLRLSAGYHSYSGDGWSDFEPYTNDFSGPAGELGVSLRTPPIGRAFALVGVADLGYYGGSYCLPNGDGTCSTLGLSNTYFEVGGRGELFAGPFAAYAGLAFGGYSSHAHISDPTSGSVSNDRTTGSASVTLGLALAVHPTSPIRLYGEIKVSSADGKYPGATNDWDMGGATYFIGMEIFLPTHRPMAR